MHSRVGLATILLVAAQLTGCAGQASRPEIRGSLHINGGARYTATRGVTLHIEAAPEPAEMIIAENSRFEGAGWVAYSPEANWTLSPGRGMKTLFIKLRGPGRLESDTLASSIMLDATPILNLVQPITPEGVPEPRRRVKVTPGGGTPASDLKLVYDDGVQPVYFDSLDYPDLWLPDSRGCLYVFGQGHRPAVELVEAGDLTVPAPEESPELREDQFWVSGCVPQGLEGPSTVVLAVDEAAVDQAGTTPQMPYFRLLGQRGPVIVQVVDNHGDVLAQEAAHLAPAYSIDRTFIIDIELGHVEEWLP